MGLRKRPLTTIRGVSARRAIRSREKYTRPSPTKNRKLSVWIFRKAYFQARKKFHHRIPSLPMGLRSGSISRESPLRFLITRREKPSKIPFLRCAACVRRYFRSIKALPYHRAYRHEAFGQWPYVDPPGSLPNGSLRKHTVSFLRQEDRPAQSTVP